MLNIPGMRPLHAIKGALGSLSPSIRASIKTVSPAADRLLEDLQAIVNWLETLQERVILRKEGL